MDIVNNKSIKEQIREYVIGRISSGEWELGARIPTRVEFERLFKTTAVTVNAALRPLVQEGFLTASGKAGTYVHLNPPPFDHFALVFPQLLDPEGQAPKFRDALQEAAERVEERSGVTFRLYHDFSAHVDNTGYLQLADDVRKNRLAGIIFGNWPYGMEKTPLFKDIQLPMIANVSHFVSPKVITVRYDSHALHAEMARILKEKESTRPAAITQSSPVGRTYEDVVAAFAESGINMPKEFVQFVNHATPWIAEHVVRLLFRLPENERPDGILIGDDNLTDVVMTTLIDILGKSAARLPITTHVNLPLEGRALLPGTAVGFDLEDMLLTVIKEMSTPGEETIATNSYLIRPVCQPL